MILGAILLSLSLTVAVQLIEIVMALCALVGFLYGVFKVISWVKSKFVSINDNVIDLKDSMDKHMTDLKDVIQKQTESITDELKEQRQDFRTFFAPVMLQAQLQSVTSAAAPVRAKRSVNRRRKS